MSIKTHTTNRGTVYEVRLRGQDGREVSRRFRTKADAANYEAAQVTAKARGAWVDPTASSMTFATAADEWMTSNPAKRASSLDRDRSALRKHLLPPLGHRRIGAITKPEVQALVNGWTERLEPRSVHRIYGTLRAVLNYAVDCDWIGRSPCRGIKLPARPRTRRRIPTADELIALTDAMRPDYAPMVWIGVVTGLRWGEVAGLRVGHVDLLRRTITVQEQVTRGRGGRTEIGAPKSEAGNRTLRIPPQLADVIGAHLATRGLTGADHDRLLFPAPNTDNRPLDYGNWRLRIWLPAVAAAQLEGLGFHDLRRANATAMVRQNVDLKTAQTRLGHSDPRLTLAVYAQATTEGDDEAADKLGDVFMTRTGTTLTVVTDSARAKRGHDTASHRKTRREGGIRTRDLSVPNAAR